MPRGKVFNLSKYHVLEFVKQNINLLISFLFVSLGLVLGLIFFDEFKLIFNLIKQFFEGYITLRKNSGFLKITLFSYLKILLLFMVLFVSGSSLFGIVTIPITLFGCGFFYGSAVAYLYSQFALKGVAFNAVIFLPSSLVLLLVLVFVARQAMLFSLHLARLTLPNSFQGDLFLKFKDYSLKFLFLTLSAFSASVLDGVTAISMLKFFEF